MTLLEFNTLSYSQQLALTITKGVYLMSRLAHHRLVKLCHLPGIIFVELYHDGVGYAIIWLRGFPYSAQLDFYLHEIQLPRL